MFLLLINGTEHRSEASSYTQTHKHIQWNSPISLDTDLFSLHARRFYFHFLRVARHKGNQWERNVFFCVEWKRCFFLSCDDVDGRQFEVCSACYVVDVSFRSGDRTMTLSCIAKLNKSPLVSEILKLILSQLISISRAPIKTVSPLICHRLQISRRKNHRRDQSRFVSISTRALFNLSTTTQRRPQYKVRFVVWEFTDFFFRVSFCFTSSLTLYGFFLFY